MKETLENKKSTPYGREWCLTLNPEASDIGRVERDLTFLENSIDTDTTLYLWNAAPDDVW